MKKILFFILVFTSNLCFAQIEVQKEELIEHQGIVTVSGKSANAIYDQLKIWAVTQFPNDSAVQLDDKENGKAEAVQLRWTDDYDGGRVPECPSCGQMPYSLERCIFCGQKFLPDALTEELSKPPEEVRMDCPSCGGENTLVGARARSNGHFHGRCTACGCVVME